MTSNGCQGGIPSRCAVGCKDEIITQYVRFGSENREVDGSRSRHLGAKV